MDMELAKHITCMNDLMSHCNKSGLLSGKSLACTSEPSLMDNGRSNMY